jgi:hypothetical protein
VGSIRVARVVVQIDSSLAVHNVKQMDGNVRGSGVHKAERAEVAGMELGGKESKRPVLGGDSK